MEIIFFSEHNHYFQKLISGTMSYCKNVELLSAVMIIILNVLEME